MVFLSSSCYFTKMRKLIYITIPFLYILISCDKGLSPNLADEKVGFGGTVTFSGQWDPDIIQTHVVAFENPLLDVSDFNVPS